MATQNDCHSLRAAAQYAAHVLEMAASNPSNDPENRRIYADAAAELREALEKAWEGEK